MADFLLELLTEEIPARMQARAAEELGRLFGAALATRGLGAAIQTHVTPRRLALLARALPAGTPPTREERRGPRTDAPAPAIEGFLRSTGLAREALEERQDPKGRFLYAVIDTPGRPTAEVLPEVCVEAVGALGWPKSMRWGAASLSMDSPRWVRPIEAVVALLDDALVPMELLGVPAGRRTRGHRFMSQGWIEVAGAQTYAEQLRAAHVVLDAAERRRIIAEGARAAAAAAGLSLIEDDGLVAENAGLTEWPVPLLGRFDPNFLSVPREVIQLTMRTNQKYFAASSPDGALAPAFVCVANIVAPDRGARIVEGNRRVLAARLADARFFWEQDLKDWREASARGPDGLFEHFAPRLERITFHEKLGTMREKAERVAGLARWLAESGAVPGADAALAERAGLLCKADLVSAAVGEFPELQGVMGGHYALAVGEDASLAAAIRLLYDAQLASPGWAVGPLAAALGLADRADTLRSFFLIGEAPTGSRDPFALRRAALQCADIIARGGVRVSGRALFGESAWPYVLDRYRHQFAGVRHDFADAVIATAATDDDLLRLSYRFRALGDFIGTEDGRDLLTAYRRAANILKQAGDTAAAAAASGPAGADHPAQAALADALSLAEPRARAAVEAEDFSGAMAALATLRAPIDGFFEGVMVNDADPAVRAARLALLDRFVQAVHAVADFSKIVD